VILQNGVFNSSGNTLTLVVYNYGKIDLDFRPIVTYINGSTYVFNKTVNSSAGEIISETLNGVTADLEQITIQSVECTAPCYYCPGAQDLLLSNNIRGL
jgi:hypothetical protein